MANGEDRRLKMSAEMKALLSSNGCTREYLKKYFGCGDGREEGASLNCCSYHDNIAIGDS